jgi:hypothetical protein
MGHPTSFPSGSPSVITLPDAATLTEQPAYANPSPVTDDDVQLVDDGKVVMYVSDVSSDSSSSDSSSDDDADNDDVQFVMSTRTPAPQAKKANKYKRAADDDSDYELSGNSDAEAADPTPGYPTHSRFGRAIKRKRMLTVDDVYESQKHSRSVATPYVRAATKKQGRPAKSAAPAPAPAPVSAFAAGANPYAPTSADRSLYGTRYCSTLSDVSRGRVKESLMRALGLAADYAKSCEAKELQAIPEGERVAAVAGAVEQELFTQVR